MSHPNELLIERFYGAFARRVAAIVGGTAINPLAPSHR